MKLSLKVIVISVFLLFGAQSLAWTSDYVPAFKPVKKSKSLAELQKNIKRDIFQAQSLINAQKKKKIIGFTKNDKHKRIPAEI